MTVKLFFLFTNKINGVVPLNVLVTLLETVLLVLVLRTQFRSSENKIERTCNVWSFWDMELYYWKWWCKNILFVVLAKKILGIVRMSLLNCAPCAPSCLRALPIVSTCLACLRAYVPYQLLICACVPYEPYEPTSLKHLCLVLCCVATIER